MTTNLLIMLVDDEDIVLFINELTIKSSGIAERFVKQKNGAYALDYLKNNINTPENLPDFIFLDLNMPVMDGKTFMSNYEELPDWVKEKSKVIILSSSLDKRDKDYFKENSYVIGYLAKPLSDNDLKEVLTAHNNLCINIKS